VRDLALTYESAEFRDVEAFSEFPRGRVGEGGTGGGLLAGILLGLAGVLPSLLTRRERGGTGGSFFSLATRSILMTVLLTMFGGTTLLAVSVIVGEETLDFALLTGEFCCCPGTNTNFSHSVALDSYSFWTFSRISNSSAHVGLSSGFSLQHNWITTKETNQKRPSQKHKLVPKTSKKNHNSRHLPE
jgi:hypothetical protein